MMMKKDLLVLLLMVSLLSAAAGNRNRRQAWNFFKGAVLGAKDMYDAYRDMREANWVGADKYFHARGNYDAAQRGPGGKWVAEVLSDARESWQGSVSGRGAEDTMADQFANKWGREGLDPNVFRPPALPSKY